MATVTGTHVDFRGFPACMCLLAAGCCPQLRQDSWAASSLLTSRRAFAAIAPVLTVGRKWLPG